MFADRSFECEIEAFFIRKGDCMELPKRKIIRLNAFDYSRNGAYFVTVCTRDREHSLGVIVGTTIGRPHAELSPTGEIVEHSIQNIGLRYKNIRCTKYAIMPNHIHMIIEIQNADDGGRPMVVPTLSVVVNQMKGYVSKQVGCSVWQRSFHDHIIRNEKEYQEIWQYIDINPLQWELDCYYES